MRLQQLLVLSAMILFVPWQGQIGLVVSISPTLHLISQKHGAPKMTETHSRTIVRTITYRLTAWLLTIFLTYLFTRNISEATEFSTLLHLVLSFDYYLHERIWLKIKWGKIEK